MTWMLRSPTDHTRSAHSGRGKLRTLAPMVMTKMACTRKCTANDVSSMVKSDDPRTHRKATNSMATEVATAAAKMSGAAAHHAHPALTTTANAT